MKLETLSPANADQVAPPDLEIHVETVNLADGIELRFTLNSLNAFEDYYFRPAGVQRISGEKSFREISEKIFTVLEQLHGGKDDAGRQLLPDQIAEELRSIGRDLYSRLFSDTLKSEYRKRIREKARSLLIVSNEAWPIPWELLVPHGEDFDDDFLCMKFELTRWISGGMPPLPWLRVGALEVIGTGGGSARAALPKANDEHALLLDLCERFPGVEGHSLPELNLSQLNDLLRRGGFELLHLVGHGEHFPEDPQLSAILVGNHAFLPRHLIGPIPLRLRQDRPLVFFNTCSAARSGWWISGLAGWTERWIRGCGCGAFLAPQWSVRDASAFHFAQAFYHSLAEGQSFAQAVQTARKTTRDTHPENLSWAAYAIYSHPNGRVSFGSFTPKSPARVPDEIRTRILDFGRFIAEKTDGFVGRDWLFERFERFQQEHPRGYFLLRGDPGIGKSSLAAELVKRLGCVHHFNIRAEGIHHPVDFWTNICAQLIAAYSLPLTTLPPEATRDGSYFKSLLEQIVALDPDRKVVLVVDALDEAISIRPDANPLHLPSLLPPGVYLLATARRSVILRVECELKVVDIQQDEAGNLADVRAHLEACRERPGIASYLRERGISDKTFVDLMTTKSQGNFMYLRYVLPEIEHGDYRDLELGDLPSGLTDYYEDHWRRLRSRDPDRWFQMQLPVLVALTVVKEPVSVDLLVDFSGVADRNRIRDVLREWDSFLYQTVVEDETSKTGKQKRFRLYHDSFHDFIAAKDEIEEEKVSLKAANRRIADVLWNELYGDDAAG